MAGEVVEAQSFSVKRAQVEFHNFASLGEPERAIAPLEAALALDPGLPQAYANLGFAYGRAGRLDDAARTFRAGLGEAAALVDLAVLHDERNEPTEARALRERAYALDPDLRPKETSK